MNRKLLPLLFFFCWQFNVTLAQQNVDSTIMAIGETLDSSINNFDASFFQSIFSTELFLKEVMLSDTGNTDILIFNEGFKRKDAFSDIFLKPVFQLLKSEGYYSFINYYTDEWGDYYLLFRLYGEEGINYHQYYLTEVNGEFRVGDIFIFLTGEYLSETIRLFYLAALKSDVGGYVLSPYDSLLLDGISKMGMVNRFLSADMPQEARQVHKSIPDTLFHEPLFLLFEMQFLLQIDSDKEYLKLIDTYLENQPSPASVFLVSMDGFILRKEYKRAMDVVDSLYLYTDDDFLDFFRASITYLEGDMNQAIYYSKRLVENFPYFPEGYDFLLFLLVEETEFDMATQILEESRVNLEVEKKDLVALVKEAFPSLYRNSSFKKWKRRKTTD